MREERSKCSECRINEQICCLALAGYPIDNIMRVSHRDSEEDGERTWEEKTRLLKARDAMRRIRKDERTLLG